MSANRDVDSPDTIVSSSSPECVIPEFIHRFPGLRLIEEESDEESDWLKRVSPVIPLISPIPIRLKPAYIKDMSKQDKENLGVPRYEKSPFNTIILKPLWRKLFIFSNVLYFL